MSPRREALVLFVLLLLAAGARARYFTGLQVADDLVYSRIAADHLRGDWNVWSVHAARRAFVLPLAASYALFGPGETPLVLYGFLCSVGLVAVSYFLARRYFGPLSAGMAALLVAVHPLLVYYATDCHTDTPLAFWSALGILAFLRADDSPRPVPLLIAVGLLLGWAYLTKEAVVALAPFWVGHKWVRRRPWSWYLPILAPCLAVVAGEAAYYGATTGDPWYRYHLIRRLHIDSFMRPVYSEWGSILFRMFAQLPGQLFVPSPKSPFTWHRILSLACAAAGLVLWRRKTRGVGVFGGWFLSLYFFYSFWPSSFLPFRPGFVLHQWTLPVFVVPLACCGGGLFRTGGVRTAIVGILVVGLGLFAAHRSLPYARRWGDGPREARAWIDRENPPRVVSDPHTLEAFDFFDGHRPRRRYEAFEKVGAGEAGIRVVDRLLLEPNRWWSVEVPSEVRCPPPGWEKVYESPRIVIYRCGGDGVR